MFIPLFFELSLVYRGKRDFGFQPYLRSLGLPI